MRTLLDFTEDASPNGDPLPDPSSITTDGDDVVVTFRETELRMTFPQFFDITEAFNRWIFKGLRGEVEFGDPDHCGAEEHHRLREIVGEMVNDGKCGDAAIGDDVRLAIQGELKDRKIDVRKWQSQEAFIRALKDHIEELEGRLDARAKRKARQER
jgi:hypothetical protein